MTTAPNRNIFWAKTFVDELARCGLEAVCIAPGSRSTPLVIAFAENPHIKVYSHIDERSTAFFALGLALATDKPVAILCSSGTATANFHPAVIEARYANVPLLVLTADRSHELRDSGANQTIDQVKMFGSHVLWAYDAALPEANPPAIAIRNLRTLADRAYAKANGVMGIEKGPVHINFPFRKPLEPIPVEGDVSDILQPTHAAREQFTRISRGYISVSNEDIWTLVRLIEASAKGMIICGPRSPYGFENGTELEESFWETILHFAELTGYPILADPLANLRFAMGNLTPNIERLKYVVGGYDGFLRYDLPIEAPDILILFGSMPTSANLENYLNSIGTNYRIQISENGGWTDANHNLTHFIQADPTQTCLKLIEAGPNTTPDLKWLEKILTVEQIYWEIVTSALNEQIFDGSAVAATVNELPDFTGVYVASSLPVRHLEYVKPDIKFAVSLKANRGASGIDGTISSALGAAAGNPNLPTVLITGDLAFYHDLNGLLAVKRCGIKNITIVLINNDGGGIFQRLPIRDFDPPFTDLFLTPHGLDFEPAVRMYGLEYHHAETLPELREKVKNAVGSDVPTVIEVRTDSKRDLERRNEINRLVQERLRELFKN